MRIWLACAGLLAMATASAAMPLSVPTAAATPFALVALFDDWRGFVEPAQRGGVSDYGSAAMLAKATALAGFRARLKRLDRNDWDTAAATDYELIEAEISGYDFDLRVLRPWARDPSFYRTVFADESDVPAHEGPSAVPAIDLFKLRWPLSPADHARLTAQLRSIPRLLAAARLNLAGGNARDLWAYGDRTFREQSEVLGALGDGKLAMRTLEGAPVATITGASARLRVAITDARVATDAFAAWIAVEARTKTGPSGIGKADYDWYAANVQRSRYGWAEQMVLLQRELDRSLTSLRLEELRNRNLPPLAPIENPAAFRAMAAARTARLNNFLVDTGLVPDRSYFRAALAAQTSDYTPLADRNFFSHVTALDPLPLLSHSTHWIELARLKHEPHASPIRRRAPLFNIFADRSEGFATAMEEVVMQAGLYDDMPRARELVWIMLANRAARGLASLRVQANEIDLAQAGRFHAEWTPRGWSNPDSPLVGFEQLLYLRQPGYGPSYIVGKLELDRLIARASQAADSAGQPFVPGDVFARIVAAGIVPPALIERKMFGKATPPALPPSR